MSEMEEAAEVVFFCLFLSMCLGFAVSLQHGIKTVPELKIKTSSRRNP